MVGASCKDWLRNGEVTDGGYVFRDPENYGPTRLHGPSPMRPRAIGSKLLIIAATVLAIAIASSAEAKHGGEGWHGSEGWHGGGAACQQLFDSCQLNEIAQVEPGP